MTVSLNSITAFSQSELRKYAALRPIYTSEGQFLNQFIWSEYYNTEYIKTDSYLYFLIDVYKRRSTMMPYCRVEDIESTFWAIKQYFNEELKLPMIMYLADETFLSVMKQSPRFLDEFTFEEDRDSSDYIYSADKLRTLSGKAYHKKKNHVNAFLKEYAGRFEYSTLSCRNMDEIEQFHEEWLKERTLTDHFNSIRSEEDGVHRIFDNCFLLDCKLGGIYIDGKLEAYSIGSYNPNTKYAYIHIEKANPNFRGLYNYINQQFLIHEFPEAEFVNREDDLGQEGLRKSKLSYKPIRLETKYVIREK
ncbi:DUF2156 domain-containing protein [Velocimicrobium porci]|uniref:DUF2156 domain-containing protein n=1 Tax=Velocimicrobium porci TaxID=2606634 RepID=A0A6L5XV99_9FIRM|nr:phosphatidylglycerol lysyltransferase domain-containing protein [Velocimicrobium porci]MSS62632.1 DUF2156 domain-containing protein [Velocimicrobium porci]